MSGPLPEVAEYRRVVVPVTQTQQAENNDMHIGSTPEAGDEVNVHIKDEDEDDEPEWKKNTKLIGVLEWSKRPAGGLIADIRRRGPYYLSDWTDAFKTQNLSVTAACTLFLFFACFAPALAFGAIFDVVTEGEFGIVEMILSTAISGIIYSIFSGQPMTIMGATGPELAYTIVFYQMCVQLDVEFLPARFWQGVWTSLFTVLLAITDSCCLMHYVTRFTEEIFSALVSTIEILTAFLNIVNVFTSDASIESALLSLILAVFTYGFAIFLRDFKSTDWFTSTVRKQFANYGTIIAILAATIIAAVMVQIYGIELEYLNVPTEFSPTKKLNGKSRPWIIDPINGFEKPFPVWAMFATAIPAIGLTILGYLDQNLTEVIINGKDRKLQKPPGYHLDLFTCGAIIYPPCSLLGLQFTHAATVRSLAHLLSLTQTDVVPSKDGKRMETKITGVIEQRFTHFIVHVLIACSLLLTSVLRLVPRSVIIGIFLYLGTSSVRGNSLFDRLFLLLVWDKTRWPLADFTTKVETKTMVKFTLIQGGALAVIFALSRIGEVAVVFPFFIGLLIPFRKFVARFFSEHDMAILDK
jgi:hypothetical protein